jgi:putative transcriptional regulator
LGTVDLGREPVALPVAVQNLRVFAGYAGWSGGQLDGEVESGGWFVFDVAPDDVFTSEPATLWASVLRRQGGRMAMFANAPAHPSLN